MANERDTVKRPRVSLIIPHFKGNFLLHCLQRIEKSSSKHLVEIIIVVDGADVPAPMPQLSEADARSLIDRIIHLPQRGGYGAACNAGARVARSEILAFLNDDVLVADDYLDDLLEELEKYPDVAVVCPKILSLRNPGFFDYAGAAGGFIDGFGLPFARGRVFGNVEPDRGQYDSPMDVFWASGCCFVIRRQVFEALGGFSETFFMQMEEVDLCWRVHAQGLRVRSVPSSRVLHYGGFSLAENSVQKIYLNHRNSILLLLRNLPKKRLWWRVASRFALEFCSIFWCLFRPLEWRHSAAAVGCLLNVLCRPGPFIDASRAPRSGKAPELIPGFYSQFIVWSYFVQGKKRFSDLTAPQRERVSSAPVLEAAESY